jgi:hypothetical protein
MKAPEKGAAARACARNRRGSLDCRPDALSPITPIIGTVQRELAAGSRLPAVESPPLVPGSPTPERLQVLARQLHALGERPLYEWMLEVSRGADPWRRLEAYARLAPLKDFIRQHGGDRLAQRGAE